MDTKGIIADEGRQLIAQLVIKMDTTGFISVEGCIENRVMAYGLMGVARDVVDETCVKIQQEKDRRVSLSSDADLARLGLVKQ